MTHCPRCLQCFADHCTECPDCRQPTVRGPVPIRRDRKREQRLVSVYQPMDALEAGNVVALLEQGGLRATAIEDRTVNLRVAPPPAITPWGVVCVLEVDAPRAAQLIEEYFRAVSAPVSSGDPEAG